MTDSRDSKSDTERDRMEPGPERPQRRTFMKGAGLAAGGIAAAAVGATGSAHAQGAWVLSFPPCSINQGCKVITAQDFYPYFRGK